MLQARARSLQTRAGRRWALSPRASAKARALSENDAATARAALAQLRESRGSLDDLAEARETSARVSRRTLRGRWETGGLEHLDARLGEADLLFESALFLARAVHQLLDERGAAPEWLCRAAENLASGAETLAEDPERELIGRLRSHGLQFEETGPAPGTEGPLAGKTFVITGTLPELSRERATELIEEAGGKVTGSVSKKTDYLVAGADPGSKLAQADRHGTEVIDEERLLALLGG